jgi:hypothetical protein
VDELGIRRHARQTTETLPVETLPEETLPMEVVTVARATTDKLQRGGIFIRWVRRRVRFARACSDQHACGQARRRPGIVGLL